MEHSILTKTLWASIGVIILTVIHHGYGALIYEASFRLHVAFFILPVLALLIFSYRKHGKQPSSQSGRISLWIFMVLTIVFSIGLIGLFEGGYNHLLKNVLFFGGASHTTLEQLFPPPTYEMPNNFWFEATGILQFFAGVHVGVLLIKFWRATSQSRAPERGRP